MRKRIRTFTATDRELRMLAALARYHGCSKSATITNLVKKEFWRVYPAGTPDVVPEPGARIVGAAPLSGALAAKEDGAP